MDRSQQLGSSSANLFNGARDIHIHNSHFNASALTAPAVGAVTPSSQSSPGNLVASQSHTAELLPGLTLYQRQMTLQGRGFPLYFPQPSLDLPLEYRTRGISIGDVGRFNQDGGFDFLFNVLLPADDPINGGEVPDDFEPLSLSGQRNFRKHLREERCLAHPIVDTIEMDTNGLTVESNAPEGAILMLPDPVHTTDCTNISAFRRYAAENSESWYMYVNGPQRGWNLMNGDLRLVYGCDQAATWGIATFAGTSSRFKGRFGKSQQHNTPYTPTLSGYTWQCSGTVGSLKAGPSVCDALDLEVDPASPLHNQTLFLRTLTISLNDAIWRSINGEESITQELDPGVGRDGNTGSISRMIAAAAPLVFMFFQRSSGSDKTAQSNSKGIMIEESDLPPVCHPSTAINCILFQLCPNARVAITTDEAWVDNLPEDWMSITPDTLSELLQLKTKAIETGDVVYMESTPSIDDDMESDGFTRHTESASEDEDGGIHPCHQSEFEEGSTLSSDDTARRTVGVPSYERNLTPRQTTRPGWRQLRAKRNDSEPDQHELPLRSSTDLNTDGSPTTQIIDQMVNSGQPCAQETPYAGVSRTPSPANVARSFAFRPAQTVPIQRLSHAATISAVAFSPDGTRIASSSRDEIILMWEPYTGQQVGTPLGGHSGDVLSVAFSFDGLHLASGSADNMLCIWDAVTGISQSVLRGHTDAVQSVAFPSTSEEKLVASGSADRTVRLWNYETGNPVYEPIKGHSDGVRAVAFSPAVKQKMIVSGADDGTVRIWEYGTEPPVQWGEPLVGHAGRGVLSVAFSPDGKYIASGGMDGAICLWDIGTKPSQFCQPIRMILAHTSWVKSVTVSKDGRQVASGSFDRTVRLWDMRSGRQIADPLGLHDFWVYSVAFSPDGKNVISGSRDKTIRFWDAEAATERCRMSEH